MMRYISILITLLTSYFAWSQKPYAEIIVEPRNVEVGQQFSVIVKSNISGQIEIKLPEEFEQGFNVLNRMEQDYDGNTGEMITFFFHGRSGSITKPGKYTFGPALITKGGTVYRSNRVTVRATEEKEIESSSIGMNLLRKPAFGLIELSKEKVYAGEAFTAECKIISQFKPTHYDSYHPFSFEPAGDQHKLSTSGQPTVERGLFKNQKRYLFDHDKHVVFLNSPGKVKIQPFVMSLQAGFQGFEIQSRKNHIKVLPLPKGAPSSFTGGVGKFEVSSNSNKTSLRQGDMLTFTLVLSGQGNLHDINRPKVNFGEHFEIYGDPEIKEKFAFTQNGAQGEIHIVYHLQAVKGGEGKFNPILLSYFDPTLEKYETVSTQPTSIEVEVDPNFVVENNSPTKVKEAKINRFNSAEEDTSGSFFSSTTFKVIGISTPLCAAFLFLLFRKKREEEEEPVAKTEKSTELPLAAPKTSSAEFLSILQAHANNGNELPFFSQLSQDLRKSISQAAKNDPDWVLSTDDVKSYFSEKAFSQEFQNEFFTLQQTCELCRYGCQKPEDDLQIYVDKAKTIFEKLEN